MKSLLLIVLCLIVHQANAQQPVINEIVAGNNSGILDGYNDYEDWIELYNPSSQSIDITGYFLSDDKNEPDKWQLGTAVLQGHGHLLIFASKKLSDTLYQHASFTIKLEGEEVFLFDSDTLLIDSFPEAELQPDLSYGRYPDGSSTKAYLSHPTPATNNVAPVTGIVDQPEFNTEPGIYSSSIQLKIEHDDPSVKVYYTLDGSEPDTNSSQYIWPITIGNTSSQPNSISLVPTNPAFDYPKGRYSSFRAQNRGWVPPYSVTDKLNTVRAKAFKQGYAASTILSGSYLIDNTGVNELPVVSILTDADGLFSDTNGILVYGSHLDGNYSQRGRQYERPIHFTYFDQNSGEVEFEFDGGIRVHGGGGRHSAIKNLRVYTRDSYGSDEVDFFVAGDKGPAEFKRFLVRGPGHRPDCFPRDDLANLLVENLVFDKQHLRYINMYLNNEYWGVYALKERQDSKHFKEVYGIEEEDLTILESYGKDIAHGASGDEQDFLQLLDYVDNNSLTVSSNYAYVADQIDIADFIDYQVAEIYFANGDWPNNNVRYWRKKQNTAQHIYGHDGKWRWIFYDLDSGFGGDCSGFYPASPGLRKAMLDTGSYEKYTRLFRKLLENNDFMHQFINRGADLLNTSFLPSRGGELMDKIASEVDGSMWRQVNRWRYPSSVDSLVHRYTEVPNLNKWTNIKSGIKMYMNQRPFFYRRHIMEELAGTDTLSLTVQVNDESMGIVKVNSIRIDAQTDGIGASVYPWIGTYFKDVPFPVYAIPKPGFKFVEWLENSNTSDSLMIDLQYDSVLTAVFEVDQNYQENKFYINEFMASNDATIQDDIGEYPDWIEIYNASNDTLNLTNYYISDKSNNLTKHQLVGASDFKMPGKSFLLLWADDDEEIGPLHVSFKLSSGGEQIFLVNPDGFSIEDSISFGAQTTDVSMGRNGDAQPDWVLFGQPTPKQSNIPVSIEEYNTDGVQIYPNPSEGIVNFSELSSGIVVDLHGKQVLRFERVTAIDLSHVSNGIYGVVLHSGKTEKVVVLGN